MSPEKGEGAIQAKEARMVTLMRRRIIPLALRFKQCENLS
jgi:hypothetical protein